MSPTDLSTLIPGYAAGTWTIDTVHTHLGFSAKHLMVSKVRGHFTGYSGTITTGEKAEDTRVGVTIDATSIDTNNAMRDNHIRSADFFDVENHPQFTFVSTGLRVEDGEIYLNGDLTIRGTTRPVTLAVEDPSFGENPMGGFKFGASATTEINRMEYGVSYNGPVPGGGVMISEKIQITIEVEADLNQE
jgi:polyisoprenoid-binding protein YceI